MRRAWIFSGVLLLAACPAGEDSIRIVRRSTLTRPELDALRLKLNGNDWDAASAAARTLGESRDPAAIPPLWEFYNRGNGQRRALAVQSIGALGETREAPQLVRVALGDHCQAVRLHAADALAQLVPQSALSSLAEAASEPRRPLPSRVRALQAIARTGGKAAAQTLIPYLAHNEAELVLAAAEGLGALRDTASADALIKGLASADDERKQACAEALEAFSGKSCRFDLVKWHEWAAALKNSGVSAAQTADSACVPRPYGEPLPAPEGAPADLAVLFDTTGSMTRIWPELSAAIDAVLAESVKQNKSLRLGSVKYRAPGSGGKYVIAPLPLTRKHQRIRDDLLNAPMGGSSGALYSALAWASLNFTWRANARKVILIAGDTLPTGSGLADAERLIADLAQTDGTLVHALYVRSAHGDEPIAAYWRMVRAGKGRFYEYNKAERHLVELTTEKLDARQTELPAQTASKLLTPRETP